MTAADLLAAWRDATRAAELAARLAVEAEAAAEEAEADAVANEDLVKLAEAAAAAAEQAAQNARRCAERARSRADTYRADRVPDAMRGVADARAHETEARDRYHRSARGGDGGVSQEGPQLRQGRSTD